jgi:hypothetical protein
LKNKSFGGRQQFSQTVKFCEIISRIGPKICTSYKKRVLLQAKCAKTRFNDQEIDNNDGIGLCADGMWRVQQGDEKQ